VTEYHPEESLRRRHVRIVSVIAEILDVDNCS